VGAKFSRIRNYQELIRTAIKQNYDLQLARTNSMALAPQLAVTVPAISAGAGNGTFSGGKESTFQTKV